MVQEDGGRIRKIFFIPLARPSEKMGIQDDEVGEVDSNEKICVVEQHTFNIYIMPIRRHEPLYGRQTVEYLQHKQLKTKVKKKIIKFELEHSRVFEKFY